MPEHLSTETAFTEFDSSRNLLYRLRTWILAAGVSALTTFLTLTGTLHHAPSICLMFIQTFTVTIFPFVSY